MGNRTISGGRLMFTYSQKSGQLSRNGDPIAKGYSGAGPDKNNPSSQMIHDKGPIPRGLYSIAALIQFTVVHGPYVLQLTPDRGNQMWGRGGMLIHGDSKVAPGSASEGCIILSRDVRERIWESGDHELTVTA